MPPREKNTINAINSLMRNYPFASSLLIYGLIEQELKFFLLYQRSSYPLRRVDNSVTIPKTNKQFSHFSSLSDSQFVRKCLHKCTLGTLERILRIKSRRISVRRNNLLHLNKYVQSEHKKPTKERLIIDKDRLRKAVKDLLYCSDRFFADKVVLRRGKLVFRS
jgi:hypothetical protein